MRALLALLALLVLSTTAEAQLSITATATELPVGQPYSITCTIVTNGTIHDLKCDGYGYLSCSGNVCTQTRNYTQIAGGRTHTVSALVGAAYQYVSVFVAASGTSCAPFVVTPSPVNIGATGGVVDLTVTGTAGCARTATSNASWITVTAGATGMGSGTVSLNVAENIVATARTGTVLISGQTVTITQAAGTPPPPPQPPPTSPCVDGPFTVTDDWPANVWTFTSVDLVGCPVVIMRPLAPRFDDFARPDGAPGPNWAWQQGALGTPIIRNGTLGSTNTGLVIAWWTPDLFGPDQWSEITVAPNFNPAVLLQVFVRRQATTLCRYGFHYQASTGKYTLKYDGCASAPGISFVEVPGVQFQPGDVVRLEVYGTTLRGLINGVVVISGTHTALTGGQTGLVINPYAVTAQQAVEQWRGGSLP